MNKIAYLEGYMMKKGSMNKEALSFKTMLSALGRRAEKMRLNDDAVWNLSQKGVGSFKYNGLPDFSDLVHPEPALIKLRDMRYKHRDSIIKTMKKEAPILRKLKRQILRKEMALPDAQHNTYTIGDYMKGKEDTWVMPERRQAIYDFFRDGFTNHVGKRGAGRLVGRDVGENIAYIKDLYKNVDK